MVTAGAVCENRQCAGGGCPQSVTAATAEECAAKVAANPNCGDDFSFPPNHPAPWCDCSPVGQECSPLANPAHAHYSVYRITTKPVPLLGSTGYCNATCGECTPCGERPHNEANYAADQPLFPPSPPPALPAPPPPPPCPTGFEPYEQDGFWWCYNNGVQKGTATSRSPSVPRRACK